MRLLVHIAVAPIVVMHIAAALIVVVHIVAAPTVVTPIAAAPTVLKAHFKYLFRGKCSTATYQYSH
jgi:hypothetical protein